MKLSTKIITVLLILTSIANAKPYCVPEGTSLEEIMLSNEFKTASTETILNQMSEALLGMFRYRHQNCEATPDEIKQNCRSSCVLVKRDSYRDVCNRFCEIQRLKLESISAGICRDKLQALVDIEKDIRQRAKEEQAATEEINQKLNEGIRQVVRSMSLFGRNPTGHEQSAPKQKVQSSPSANQ